MPFGASKVILVRLCLRSLIKATEKQKARALAYTVLPPPGLKKATASPSPAHTATCLALPFTSLEQEKSFIQCRDACACCQPMGPSSHWEWPSSSTLVPRAQWPLPRGQGLGTDPSCSPCPSFHPSYPGHNEEEGEGGDTQDAPRVACQDCQCVPQSYALSQGSK